MMQFYIPEVLGVEQVEDESDKVANKEFEKLEQKINSGATVSDQKWTNLSRLNRLAS